MQNFGELEFQITSLRFSLSLFLLVVQIFVYLVDHVLKFKYIFGNNTSIINWLIRVTIRSFLCLFLLPICVWLISSLHVFLVIITLIEFLKLHPSITSCFWLIFVGLDSLTSAIFQSAVHQFLFLLFCDEIWMEIFC
jgi:hypothetical protein